MGLAVGSDIQHDRARSDPHGVVSHCCPGDYACVVAFHIDTRGTRDRAIDAPRGGCAWACSGGTICPSEQWGLDDSRTVCVWSGYVAGARDASITPMPCGDPTDPPLVYARLWNRIWARGSPRVASFSVVCGYAAEPLSDVDIERSDCAGWHCRIYCGCKRHDSHWAAHLGGRIGGSSVMVNVALTTTQ